MDNFRIDVTAEGRQTLIVAMQIAFRHNSAGGKTKAWASVGIPDPSERTATDPPKIETLVFFWHDQPDDCSGGQTAMLPAALDHEGAGDLAWRWLEEIDRGERPDLDGDAVRGFRVFTDAWGHVAGSHYAICGIQATWSLHGK